MERTELSVTETFRHQGEEARREALRHILDAYLRERLGKREG